MKEKICRLCLQTITKNFQPLKPHLKDILKLNLNISKAAVKCTECANNLEVFLKFKSACDFMTEETLLTDFKDDIDVEAEKISKRERTCCFCAKFSERVNLTAINDRKEHKFLVSVLKEHIPKLNLRISEELLTCQTCLDGLQSVLNFLLKCTDVEQRISKYTEMEGTDDKGQIELKDVQQFMFNPTVKLEIESDGNDLLKGKYDGFQLERTMGARAEIKYETAIENPELVIKTEDIDVKSEQSDCERFQESPTLTEIDNGSSDISGSALQRRCINQHDVTYRNSEVCAFETKCQDSLNQHTSTHKSTTKTMIFKCELCSFETKRKVDLRRHELAHRSTSGVTMFKCEICAFETIHRASFKRHASTHKSTLEVTMFKCELCSFETKRKHCFKEHKVRHRSTSEVTMFKCKLCPFESKHRSTLKRHSLTHKSTTEVLMFKCELCTYETKHKHCLKEHNLVHKNTSNVTMFKCDTCTYETKSKPGLKKHILTHKGTSEVTMFKCELCSFATKYKHYLKQHKLVHISSSETTMFKCDQCPYETKHTHYVERHMSTVHKIATEISILKCELCPYETKHKKSLSQHKSIHKRTT